MIKELKIKPGIPLKEIDFAKGIAIYLVILLHCLPENFVHHNKLICLSIGQAVPLFMFIGGFLFYYTAVTRPPDFRNSLPKLFNRIIYPFFVVIAIIYSAMFLFGDFYLRSVVFLENSGPGGYFPVVYCQIILLLILFHKLTHAHRNSIALIASSLLVCLFLEHLTLYFDKIKYGSAIYRLLCIRYVFVAILGYVTCKTFIIGFKPNFTNIVSLLLCFLASAYYSMSSENIFTLGGIIPIGWKGAQHTLSAFYTLSFFLFLVWIMKYIPSFLTRMTILAGKASYHIFLFQMIYFKIEGNYEYFDFTENTWLKPLIILINAIITLIINGLGGYFIYTGIKRINGLFIAFKKNKSGLHTLD